MSNLPGNPFAETHTINGTLTEDDGDWATAQATLALAYEQRTANLIALAQLCVSIDGPTVDLSEDLHQIIERLGLGDNK